MKRRKEALQNASEERKNFMQTMELKRKENAKPSDLEQVKKHNVCIIFCVQCLHMTYCWSKHELRNFSNHDFFMNKKIFLNLF